MSNEINIIPNKVRSPAIQTIYDGTLAEMRLQGKTLQEIGDTVGVTRERIRQILEQFYGGTHMKETIPESKLAHALGFQLSQVKQARIDGLINPSYKFGSFVRYNTTPENIASITKILLRIQKGCVHCGKPMTSHGSKYCSECTKERRRYNYPFMSAEAKQIQLTKNKNWQREHPEKVKESNKRAARKYHKKRSEQFWSSKPAYVFNREYKSYIKGDIVIGTGRILYQLKTLDNDLIPFLFLRRHK